MMDMSTVDMMTRFDLIEQRRCRCYPFPTSYREHLLGCEFYERAHDPFLPIKWKIHKLRHDEVGVQDPRTPWWVCEVSPYNNSHDARYKGAEWEHCAVWLAVESGRRRERRRMLERASNIRYAREPIRR